MTADEVRTNNDIIELGFDNEAIDWAEYWANIDHELDEDDWNIEIDMNPNDYTLYINSQPVITSELINILDTLTNFVYEWNCYHDRYRMKKDFNLK